MMTTEVKSQTEEGSQLFSLLGEMEHEQVVFCHDKENGLKAIIGIHNTVLGPALGGTRMWPYASEEEAIKDALRLSRGMTFKSAISGINLGGGKAVIIGDSRKDKSEGLWRSYGKFINSLGGKYITAEDVGTSTADMELVRMETQHVTGVPEYMGGSGDPSPVTAYGTYLGMKASAKQAWGNDSLFEKKILVQGVGHVGEYLVEYLVKENARVMITDIFEDKIRHILSRFPEVQAIDPNLVYAMDIDIYAPCALGATLNPDTIAQLKCAIVAGAANNQLADEVRDGNLLLEKNILYAPDFLINAGGVINVYMELEGYNRQRAMAATEKIYDRTLEIYSLSAQKGITTHAAAKEMAMDRIRRMSGIRARK